MQHDENSMDRLLTVDSNLKVLIDFHDHGPGICLISHVVRPKLPEAAEDAVVLINTYITDKRSVALK